MINELEILIHVFSHFYHEDNANAAMHRSVVRYSPITFDVARLIGEKAEGTIPITVVEVLSHIGAYQPDPGRIAEG